MLTYVLVSLSELTYILKTIKPLCSLLELYYTDKIGICKRLFLSLGWI